MKPATFSVLSGELVPSLAVPFNVRQTFPFYGTKFKLSAGSALLVSPLMFLSLVLSTAQILDAQRVVHRWCPL